MFQNIMFSPIPNTCVEEKYSIFNFPHYLSFYLYRKLLLICSSFTSKVVPPPPVQPKESLPGKTEPSNIAEDLNLQMI